MSFVESNPSKTTPGIEKRALRAKLTARQREGLRAASSIDLTYVKLGKRAWVRRAITGEPAAHGIVSVPGAVSIVLCVVRENQLIRLLRYFAPHEAKRYLRLDSRDVLVVEAMLRAGVANIWVLS